MFAIFLSEMLTGVNNDFIERKVAKIARAVGVSAAKHDVNINVTIGGSDDFAVSTARRMLAMRAMIFYSFGNCPNLCNGKELRHFGVFAEHRGGDFFVMGGVDMVTNVMISSYGVDDIGIQRKSLELWFCSSGFGRPFCRFSCGDFGELEATTNGIIDMTELMAPIVFRVFWKNASFDIRFQGRVDPSEVGGTD